MPAILTLSSLQQNMIGEDGAVLVAAMLQSIPCFESLLYVSASLTACDTRLGGISNAIRVEGARRVADSLRGHPRLSTLMCVCGCLITE